MELCDEIKELKVYEFYNVFWIERIGEISYKKAMGRVWKEAWDKLDTEQVGIKLG